jgi:Ca2+-binding EF-hand superfamily protein
MSKRAWAVALPVLLGAALVAAPAGGQEKGKGPAKGGPKGTPPGAGGPGGFMGPPMFGQVRKLVKQFDKDGDGRLNREERQAARAFLKKERASGRGGFGPGGRGGFGPGNFLAKPLLDALDSDKDGKLTEAELAAGVRKFFKDCDKSARGKLDEKQLAEGLNRVIPGPPGFGPPGGGPGGPPRAFGPGTMLAGAIVRRADKDKDGKVTLDELLAAAGGLFKEADKDKKGKLDQAGVAAGISLLSPAPTFGRGPGGFGPGSFLTKPLLEALDADKDGKLTREEVVAGVRKFFAAADKGKKGALDEARLTEEINRIAPGPRGFRGGPPGGPPGGFRPFGPGNFLAGAIVRRADKDKDGKVTLKELEAAAEALFKEADKDRDGKLDEKELGAALALLSPAPAFGPGGFGGRGNAPPPKPGPRVRPADVKSYPKESLYEPTVLRTLFLEFEDKDWEQELADFYHTDVEVPATLVVDGRKYPNVGVRFRGTSSYFTVGAGYKRSLNVSLDFVDKKQRLHGHKTLNLLNSHDDPGFLSTVLYSHVARKYIPTPRANFVKVVLNGESWGVYVNAQQFNKEFIAENYKTTRGARWKVQGSPGGGGGLEYLGEDVGEYKRRPYRIKSKDAEKSWKALANLCRVLNKTPAEKLESALKPILDVDGVLWFLALDNALINNDGYWVRASDYCLYRDPKGKFHVIPHDMNEAFGPAEGFGFGPGFGPGGPGAGRRPPGVELDPLIGLDDARKPLRSRLLAVPALKARYLDHVRTIAEKELDWEVLGPVVKRYRSLIEKEVEADTRKLYSLDAFRKAVSETPKAGSAPGGKPALSLRQFAEQRRKYLLAHTEAKTPEGKPMSKVGREEETKP